MSSLVVFPKIDTVSATLSFITTSSFTREALEYTPRNETKIVLIDGELLSQLMIDYNLGCATQQIYELKKIDSDYFGED